jgi:arginine/lysine/ornithine decarboxylase
VNSEQEDVPAEVCEGRICAEYLYAYPPGIPILAPGEYIKKEHLDIMRQMEKDGKRCLKHYSQFLQVLIIL